MSKSSVISNFIPSHTRLAYTLETQDEARKIDPGTVNFHAHHWGMVEGEPLIVIMDGLLRYALSYRARWEQPVAKDGFAHGPWLAAAKGIRALLNLDGANAMKCGITTTDSKDNGAVERVFWKAMAVAGFTEADL